MTAVVAFTAHQVVFGVFSILTGLSWLLIYLREKQLEHRIRMCDYWEALNVQDRQDIDKLTKLTEATTMLLRRDAEVRREFKAMVRRGPSN